MKAFRRVALLALLLVALGLVLRKISPKHSESPSVGTREPAPPSEGMLAPNESSPAEKTHIKSKEANMSEKLAILNDRPILFFGKVVDQNNHPVAEARVRGGVMVEKIWMGGKFVDHFTVSDNDGNFSFQGLRGAEIVISISKEGYEFRSESRNFYYSMARHAAERHNPDANNPVVFNMWKQKGAEPLISDEKFYGIRGDGTPFTIYLIEGRKVEGRFEDGDLIVSVRQPASVLAGQRFDWSFEIEAPGGGLIVPEKTQYLNEAPADGYLSRFSQAVSAVDRGWSEISGRKLFLKCRGGTIFACVNAEFHANYKGEAVCSLHYLVNPRPGSRNLEYDALKVLPSR